MTILNQISDDFARVLIKYDIVRKQNKKEYNQSTGIGQYRLLFAAVVCFVGMSLQSYAQTADSVQEKYRPKFHFTPEAHWMNDPNGMVYYKGKYHLFYQYYPGGTKWGPMHWGHASSTDLVHWTNLPVALYPDTLGYIFSGSAVVDVNNTSGFGKNGEVPMVAIFTNHDPKKEQRKRNDYQNQSLAYSLDEGATWVKFAGNPVLRSPGITDFRDPKVMWYAPGKKWIMTLATKDRITFYSAPNLKDWKKESEFGASLGAHGGVWECPDLFPLASNGKTYWVLMVSINPGAPNGGSGTQYFIGNFDGKTFKPINTSTRWIDYGTDNYAGVTFANTGTRKVFIGWMNNWFYGDKVPTQSWRGATTIPREFNLVEQNGTVYLATKPVQELDQLALPTTSLSDVLVNKTKDLKFKVKSPFKLQMKGSEIKSFSISLSNVSGEKLVFGYDQTKNQYYIDRSKAGESSFDPRFSAIHYAPRVSTASTFDITLYVDEASIEVFADAGMSVMTDIFFPAAPMRIFSLHADDRIRLQTVKYNPLQSMSSIKPSIPHE
jgi:fructan beta-fructosidase